MSPTWAQRPRADRSSQPRGGLPQVSVSTGGAEGPWWSPLATPATRSPQLPGRRGRGGGLPTSEFLLPAEDLGELAQLLTGSLGLLLQPLVVLPQASHL